MFEGSFRLVGDPTYNDGKVVIPVHDAFDDPGHFGQIYTLDGATGATVDRTVSENTMYGAVAKAGGTLAISSATITGAPKVTWKYTAVSPGAFDSIWVHRFALSGYRLLWSNGTSAQGFSTVCPPVTGGCGPDWTTDLGGAMNGRPGGSGPAAVGDDQVVYADTTGTVSVLDVATGAIAWRSELGAAVNTSPAVTDSTIFVTTADDRLVALPAGGCGAATCGPLWQASLGATLTGPTVGGDVVYVGTSAGDVKAIAAAGCGSATCGVLRTDMSARRWPAARWSTAVACWSWRPPGRPTRPDAWWPWGCPPAEAVGSPRG